MLYPSTKLHPNRSGMFCATMLTDKETNRTENITSSIEVITYTYTYIHHTPTLLRHTKRKVLSTLFCIHQLTDAKIGQCCCEWHDTERVMSYLRPRFPTPSRLSATDGWDFVVKSQVYIFFVPLEGCICPFFKSFFFFLRLPEQNYVNEHCVRSRCGTLHVWAAMHHETHRRGQWAAGGYDSDPDHYRTAVWISSGAVQSMWKWAGCNLGRGINY